MQTKSSGPQLVIEYVENTSIGDLDQRHPEYSELISWCLQRLMVGSPAPEQVHLVLSGNFVTSVQDRFGDTPGANQYTIARGSGLVGGKTIANADGNIDVILHAGFFALPAGGPEAAVATQLIRRTVAHEAQHVIIRQREVPVQRSVGHSFKTANLESAAFAIIEEYRAELGVEAELRGGEARWDSVQVLDDLCVGLGVAVTTYQFHLQVDRLIFEVGAAALVAWKSLAYLAAEDQILSHKSSIAAVVAMDERRQRLLAPHWDKFVENLRLARPGTAQMSPEELATVVSALTPLLDEWLLAMGFRWTELEGGNSRFDIEPWYFEDPAFLAAYEELGRQIAST